MPMEIVPVERSIWGSIFDPRGWTQVLGGVSDIVTEVKTVWQQIEDIKGTKPLTSPPTPEPTTPPVTPKVTPSTVPPYEPKLTLADFAFKPNVALLIVGGALLVIALILRR